MSNTSYIRTSTLSYISRTSSLLSPEYLTLGVKCVLHCGAVVRGEVRCGRGCVIGGGAKVGSLEGGHREGGGGVEIGRNVMVGRGCVLPEGTRIGNECLIGVGTVFGVGTKVGDMTTVMPGTRLGDGKEYPPCVIIGGGGEILGENKEDMKERIEWLCKENWERVDGVEGDRIEFLL